MSSMRPTQIKTLALVSLAVIEAVEVAGMQGAPGGVLYAAMQAQGATLTQFQSLMGTLTRPGYLSLEDDCYRSTTSTPAIKAKLTRILAAVDA